MPPLPARGLGGGPEPGGSEVEVIVLQVRWRLEAIGAIVALRAVHLCCCVMDL